MTDDSYLKLKKSLNFIVVLYIFINIYNTILYSPQIQKTVICHNCHESTGSFFCRTDPTNLTDFCGIVLAVWERLRTFASNYTKNRMHIPPFNITEKILHQISEISEQVGSLNSRIGNDVPSPMLRKKNQIRTIHSSLAIENNTLSLKQVTDIIDGKHVLGAPDEIQEVKNAIEAYRLTAYQN